MTISSIQPIGERYAAFTSAPPSHRRLGMTIRSIDVIGLKQSVESGEGHAPNEQTSQPVSPLKRKPLFVLVICRLPSRRKAEVTAPASESSEARQKFANAKAISSDMFFGRESSAEVRQRSPEPPSGRPFSGQALTPVCCCFSTRRRPNWRVCLETPPSARLTCSGTAATVRVNTGRGAELHKRGRGGRCRGPSTHTRVPDLVVVPPQGERQALTACCPLAPTSRSSSRA